MDDNTIEFEKLDVEVNVDPKKIYFLDFDNPVFEGMEVTYRNHEYVITTVEMLPGWGWRAWVRLDATKNPV